MVMGLLIWGRSQISRNQSDLYELSPLARGGRERE